MNAETPESEQSSVEGDWAEALSEQAGANPHAAPKGDVVDESVVEAATLAGDGSVEMGRHAESGERPTASTLKKQKNAAPENHTDQGVEKAWFDSLENHGNDKHDVQSADSLLDDEANLDVILDIPVTVSMEIGRTRLPIRNLLRLNQGSVVELDRLAGEPLDVLVNGTLIAHGEVVVINDKYGIRLTDVISPAERVRKLK